MTNAVTLASLANSGYLRNRIINGAMQIDQRNGGAEVNPAVNATYYLDRWTAVSSAASKFKIGQNAGGVTPPVGFLNYLGITSTSSYSVGASEAFGIRQIIEGLNIADLNWGTANAQTITISFWVRSSLTGTFGLGLLNDSINRSYPATYTISSSNTWEYKTITVPGDTSGTWLKTNGIGLYLTWQFGYGSSLSGASNAWNAGTSYAPTGAVSIVGTNGATFYITGVQVEVGTQGTPFEWRPYPVELALCQRYYQPSIMTEYHIVPAPNATYASTYPVRTAVYMRTTPTYSFSYISTNAVGTYLSTVYSGPNGYVHYVSASVSTNAFMQWNWTATAEL